jgi:formylglycine-generating enzyme required for sulfatase activity
VAGNVSEWTDDWWTDRSRDFDKPGCVPKTGLVATLRRHGVDPGDVRVELIPRVTIELGQ